MPLFKAYPSTAQSVIIGMMRIITVIAVVLSLVFLAGCGGQTTRVALGQEFPLAVGESAAIKGENLLVTFVEVVEDSRCPTGATCIWEGRATSRVKIASSNGTQNIDLTEPGLSAGMSQQTFGNYWINFRLLPYPVVGKEKAVSDYRFYLSVSRLK